MISEYEQQKAAAIIKVRGEFNANKKVKDKDKRNVSVLPICRLNTIAHEQAIHQYRHV